MLLRFSVVSGHLLFVHFKIQLASPKCTQITSTTKVKVCLVILVHDTFSEDVLGIVRVGGYANSCKKQRVICVLCAIVSLSPLILLVPSKPEKRILVWSIPFSRSIDSNSASTVSEVFAVLNF